MQTSWRVAAGLFWLTLSCHARSLPETAPRQLLADDEVLASQRFFSMQWRKRFNAGDVIYCGQAFVEDASLHASFGPLADMMERLVFLPNPAILHGQVPIAAFWNASQIVLGFKDMKAYADDGAYASSAVVVDDNTVMVSSPVAFTTSKGPVTGRMLSEMWIRVGLQWKLRSMMFALEELGVTPSRVAQPAQGSPIAAERVASSHNNAEQATPKERAPPPAAAKKQEVATTVPVTTAAPAAPTAAPMNPAAVNDTIVAADGSAQAVTAAGGHNMLLLALMVALVAGAAAVLARRAKNRREAAIAGFESMLG